MADSSGTEARARRLSPVLRGEGAAVKPLELYFDLVFVLAFTQCTALMARNPVWESIVQAMLVLALLWWSWGGYAWLTSVVDPEEGAVRIAMFAVMAGLLVVALCVPQAFGDRALAFAIAYGVVRGGHLALFVLASRDDPDLRHSVATLAASSAIGVGLLIGASALDGLEQGAVWAIAILLDYGGPAIFGVEGWKLVPSHFAERFRLVIILALGESIVALGAGAEVELSAGVIAAAMLGIALASALWWMYFDVVTHVNERRLIEAPAGRERNALARDSYSYLHYPMVAGIVLVALGLEETLAHVDEHLHSETAFAFLGGVAAYLLGHVALRLRNAGSLNVPRFALAILLLALVPVAVKMDALVVLAGVNVLLWLVIAYETRLYGESRWRVRHGLVGHPDEDDVASPPASA